MQKQLLGELPDHLVGRRSRELIVLVGTAFGLGSTHRAIQFDSAS